jgi:hypothetical protein
MIDLDQYTRFGVENMNGGGTLVFLPVRLM